MRSLFLFICIICAAITKAQTITTIAGNGMLGSTGDGGLATAASVNYPIVCTFDSHQNFYFTEVGINKIRKINTMGIITTVAGGGSSLGDGGLATAAQLNNPVGIAIDKYDNIYIADHGNNRIRKINNSGIITTIAGNGTSGFGGDNGLASASILYNPNNLCVDNDGNVYILDGGSRIRKISAASVITTIAGNGTAAYSGDGAPATAAAIKGLRGICTDTSGNVYFTQITDNVIRKVNTAGIITTIAGNGSASGGDGGPASAAGIGAYEIQFDRSGNLYFSGYILNVVRVIDKTGIVHTVAGNGTASFGGDGSQATAAQLYTPIGMALDSCGNLYICDRDDNHIRKVSFNPLCWKLGVENEHTSTQNISIYPNPVNDELHIDNVQTRTSYSLLNTVGQPIQQGILKAGSNSISIQALANGIYLLQLTEETGKRTVNKVVKQ